MLSFSFLNNNSKLKTCLFYVSKMFSWPHHYPPQPRCHWATPPTPIILGGVPRMKPNVLAIDSQRYT